MHASLAPRVDLPAQCVSSLRFVTIMKIFVNYTLMALGWGTKWQQWWFMELLLKLPDCQIMLASLEQSCMPFHSHSLGNDYLRVQSWRHGGHLSGPCPGATVDPGSHPGI